MTTKEKIAHRKLSLLGVASNLNNVSTASRTMGYSGSQHCEIRRNCKTYGGEDHRVRAGRRSPTECRRSSRRGTGRVRFGNNAPFPPQGHLTAGLADNHWFLANHFRNMGPNDTPAPI